MLKIKINKNYCTVIFLLIIALLSLIMVDFNLHNRYGLSTDSLYHLSIVNFIDRSKSVPYIEPQTGLDKPEYPTGFHIWLNTISKISGINKNFVVFNSNFLMAITLLFLLFVFFRKMANPQTSILILIILVFSGGIGWILFPNMLGVNFKADFNSYMASTGLFEGNLFSTKLLSASTQTIGFILVFLFLYLLYEKRYLLGSIAALILSYTHRTSISFILIFLIFFMFYENKKEKRILIIPVVLLLGSILWNYYYPALFFLPSSFLMFILRVDNILRIFLLLSIVAFYIPIKKWNKMIFRIGYATLLLIFILDIFLRFNNLTGEFPIPVWKQMIFVYGPLILSFFFIDRIDDEKNKIMYVFLFTIILISQTNAVLSVMGVERILLFMTVPLAFIYSILLIELREKKFKVILMILLLFLLAGNFVDLNRYTRNNPSNSRIKYYSEVLTFIETNLSDDARIIASPGFCLYSRNGIIIPSMTGRYIYSKYVYSYETFTTQELRFSDVPPFNKTTIMEMLEGKDFLYNTDILSKRLQIAYLFENPAMNFSGTKLSALNSHILTTKKECEILKEYYDLVYSDEKVCIFLI